MKRKIMTLLDEIQPKYHLSQIREIEVEAPPEVIYQNIWDYPINESALFRVLMGMRNLPAKLSGRGNFLPKGELTVSRWLKDTYFVLLAEKEDKEIVFGFIGQFWKPIYGKVLRIPEVERFIKFKEPGYVKVAANFYIEPKDNRVRLSMEVRVYTPDKRTLRRFRIYWRIIEPFGGWLRKDMLRRIKSRAEGV